MALSTGKRAAELAAREQAKIKIVAFVRRYWRAHRYPPTITDIGTALSIHFTTVNRYVNQLVDEGKLERDKGANRSIRLVRRQRILVEAG